MKNILFILAVICITLTSCTNWEEELRIRKIHIYSQEQSTLQTIRTQQQQIIYAMGSATEEEINQLAQMFVDFVEGQISKFDSVYNETFDGVRDRFENNDRTRADYLNFHAKVCETEINWRSYEFDMLSFADRRINILRGGDDREWVKNHLISTKFDY